MRVTERNNRMKQSELMAAINAGGVFCIGTFVSGRCDTISVRDKASGQRREAHVVKEVIMTETEPAVVSRWLKDGEKAEDYKVQFKRGQKVVVRVKLSGMSGVTQLDGTLEELA